LLDVELLVHHVTLGFKRLTCITKSPATTIKLVWKRGKNERNAIILKVNSLSVSPRCRGGLEVTLVLTYSMVQSPS